MPLLGFARRGLSFLHRRGRFPLRPPGGDRRAAAAVSPVVVCPLLDEVFGLDRDGRGEGRGRREWVLGVAVGDGLVAQRLLGNLLRDGETRLTCLLFNVGRGGRGGGDGRRLGQFE